MPQDFADAHDGNVFGADDLLLALGGHLRAAEAREAGGREALLEGSDQARAVVVARGLAGGEEDARVGDGRNALSLAGQCLKNVRRSAVGCCGGGR